MAILIIRVHINVKSLFYLIFNLAIIKLLKIPQVGVGARPDRWGHCPCPPLATALVCNNCIKISVVFSFLDEHRSSQHKNTNTERERAGRERVREYIVVTRVFA